MAKLQPFIESTKHFATFLRTNKAFCLYLAYFQYILILHFCFVIRHKKGRRQENRRPYEQS